MSAPITPGSPKGLIFDASIGTPAVAFSEACKAAISLSPPVSPLASTVPDFLAFSSAINFANNLTASLGVKVFFSGVLNFLLAYQPRKNKYRSCFWGVFLA